MNSSSLNRLTKACSSSYAKLMNVTKMNEPSSSKVTNMISRC